MAIAPVTTETKNFFASANCEVCGEKFSCGANAGGCWCAALEISPENLNGLREKYKNCLCENCLSKYELPSFEKSN